MLYTVQELQELQEIQAELLLPPQSQPSVFQLAYEKWVAAQISTTVAEVTQIIKSLLPDEIQIFRQKISRAYHLYDLYKYARIPLVVRQF